MAQGLFYATLADPEGNAIIKEDPNFRVTYEHKRTTYTDPWIGEVKIGDYVIVNRKKRELLKARVLDIVPYGQHSVILYTKSDNNYIQDISSESLGEKMLVRITEEQFLNPKFAFCGVCDEVKTSDLWTHAYLERGRQASTPVCGECANSGEKISSCGHCGYVYTNDAILTLKKADNIKMCENCVQTRCRPCNKCNEWLYGNGKMIKVMHELGQVIYCQECIDAQDHINCDNCGIVILPRYELTVIEHRPGEQARIIDLRDEDEMETKPEEVPPQKICRSCAQRVREGGLGAALGRNVIHTFDYHPERDQANMRFMGKPTAHRRMLPGYNRKKQPWIARQDLKFDETNYLSSVRSGDWIGKRKVKAWKPVVLTEGIPQAPTSVFPGQLYIGMELEVEIKKKYQGTMTRNQLAAEFQKMVGNVIYIKHDGSIGGEAAHGQFGFEIITHPGTYEWFMEEFPYKRITALTRYARSYGTGTCGTHFHLSKAAFSPLHLYKFAQFHYRNREFVNFIAERYSNRYAGFRDEEGQVLSRAAKEKRNIMIQNKYLAVNLAPEYTVELRYFRGNMKRERIRKNLQFLYAVFVFSKTYGIKDMTFEKFIEYVADNRKAYPELHEYILKYGEENEE